MSTQKFSSKESIEAIVGQYKRAEEKRADMVTIKEDGGSLEANFDIKRVNVEPDDFQKGKNCLAFYFEDPSGELRFWKPAMKWGVQLKDLLESAGGQGRVLIVRSGLGIQDTSYKMSLTE